MLFVIHALDRSGGISTRAKFYRAHRIHLDQAAQYDVDSYGWTPVDLSVSASARCGTIL